MLLTRTGKLGIAILAKKLQEKEEAPAELNRRELCLFRFCLLHPVNQMAVVVSLAQRCVEPSNLLEARTSHSDVLGVEGFRLTRIHPLIGEDSLNHCGHASLRISVVARDCPGGRATVAHDFCAQHYDTKNSELSWDFGHVVPELEHEAVLVREFLEDRTNLLQVRLSVLREMLLKRRFGDCTAFSWLERLTCHRREDDLCI